MLRDLLAGMLASPARRTASAVVAVAIVAIAAYFLLFSAGGGNAGKNSLFKSTAAAAQSSSLDKLSTPSNLGSTGPRIPGTSGPIDLSGNDGLPAGGLGSAVAQGAVQVDGSTGGVAQALADTGPGSTDGSGAPNNPTGSGPSDNPGPSGSSSAAVPTTAPGEPTNTPEPGATATSVPTATSNNATATPVPATDTPATQPTETPVPATATTAPATATSVPPTATSVPPTATSVPPTATTVPPTPTPCGGGSASLRASPSSVTVGSPATVTLTASGFGCSEELSASLSSSLGSAGPYDAGQTTASGTLSGSIPVSVSKAQVCNVSNWPNQQRPAPGTSLSLSISVTGATSGKNASTSVTFVMPTC